MAEYYGCRPSELIGLKNMEYESFCFDEASAYIVSKLKSGEEPVFEKKFKSFSDFYKKFD